MFHNKNDPRTDRTNPADARQRRSRDALYIALDQLLAERPYREISVSDLAQRAGIGRQTFYRHFPSIDAMLRERFDADLAEQMAIAQAGLEGDEFDEWILRLLDFAFGRVAKEPHIYRIILSGEGGSMALARYREQIGTFLSIAPPRRAAQVLTGNANPDYVRAFYAGAISAMLLQWLENDCRPDVATMSRLFLALAIPTPPPREPA